MTGWGQTGPMASRGRSRHQLHFADRRVARDRAAGRATRATVEPGGRFRRRFDVPAGRHPVGVVRATAVGSRPGDRRGHARRGSRAVPDDVGDAWIRSVVVERRYECLGVAPVLRHVRCADGRAVAVGAIEPQFYRGTVGRAGLTDADLPIRTTGPVGRRCGRGSPRYGPRKGANTGSTCSTAPMRASTPVLSFDEVAEDSYLRERGTLVNIDGITRPRRHRGSRGARRECRPRRGRWGQTAPKFCGSGWGTDSPVSGSAGGTGADRNRRTLE